MRTIVNIFQTIGMSFLFVMILKIVSCLRKLWLKTAIKIRKKYNKKHGFAPESGIGEIDATSLSYQIDSIEGGFAATILFLTGLLLTLLISIQKDQFFCIFATILLIAAFLCCWFARNFGTKKYRILVCLSCGASLILIVHIFISLIVDATILIEYSNSINALLYIWFAVLMYWLLIDRS